MNKQFILTSFSTYMFIASTAYNQNSGQNDVMTEIESIKSISKDSTIVPKDTTSVQKTSLKRKTSSLSRYKDLAKEKERRRRIRAKYKADKLLKK